MGKAFRREKKGPRKQTKNLKIRNSNREIVINQDPRRAQKKGIVRLSGWFKSNIFSSDDENIMKDIDLLRAGKQRRVLLGSALTYRGGERERHQKNPRNAVIKQT